MLQVKLIMLCSFHYTTSSKKRKEKKKDHYSRNYMLFFYHGIYGGFSIMYFLVRIFYDIIYLGKSNFLPLYLDSL